MRVGSLGGLGFRHQPGAFGVGGEHDLEQCFFRSRRLLRNLADAQVLRQADLSAFGSGLARDEAKQR